MKKEDWISVNDALPKMNDGQTSTDLYLVCCGSQYNDAYKFLWFCYYQKGRWSDNEGQQFLVTHWMPHPELP